MRYRFVVEDEVLDAFIRLPSRKREQIFLSLFTNRCCNPLYISELSQGNSISKERKGGGKYGTPQEIVHLLLFIFAKITHFNEKSSEIHFCLSSTLLFSSIAVTDSDFKMGTCICDSTYDSEKFSVY